MRSVTAPLSIKEMQSELQGGRRSASAPASERRAFLSSFDGEKNGRRRFFEGSIWI